MFAITVFVFVPFFKQPVVRMILISVVVFVILVSDHRNRCSSSAAVRLAAWFQCGATPHDRSHMFEGMFERLGLEL